LIGFKELLTGLNQDLTRKLSDMILFFFGFAIG